MKTNSFIAASACIASLAMASSLTSCSNDEMIVDEPQLRNEIRFNVTNNHATRADKYSDASQIKHFNVSAWVRETGSTSAFGNGGVKNTSYFSDETLTKNGTAWQYASNLTRYWPNNGEILDFYAWVDDNTTNAATFSWDSQYDTNVNRPGLAFTTEDSAETMVDLLAAATHGKTYGTAVNGASAAELSFSHALSQVAVQVKVNNPKIQMQVSEVALVNISTTGDYYFATPNAIADWKTGTSYSTVTATAVKNGADFPMIAYNDADPLNLNGTDNSFMVIPGAYSTAGTISTEDGHAKTGTFIRLKCKIWNIAEGNKNDAAPLASNDLMIFGGSDFAELYVPVTFKWVMNTKYIYTISFGSGNAGLDVNGKETLVKMTWDVDFNDWTDGTYGTTNPETISK